MTNRQRFLSISLLCGMFTAILLLLLLDSADFIK